MPAVVLGLDSMFKWTCSVSEWVSGRVSSSDYLSRPLTDFIAEESREISDRDSMSDVERT